jgi:hypothetical protein
MVRRVVEILCVHHTDALAKDAEILWIPRISSAQFIQLTGAR